MPYIPQADRGRLEGDIVSLLGNLASTAELNYVLARLVHGFLLDGDPRYRDFEQAIGVLECCKLELYRAQVAPYEAKKLGENGRV